jgi:hypothetical protein
LSSRAALVFVRSWNEIAFDGIRVVAKRTYYQSQNRTHDGAFFTFEVYEEAGRIVVQGKGDKRSADKPASGAPGTAVVNSLIAELFRRGKIRPTGR